MNQYNASFYKSEKGSIFIVIIDPIINKLHSVQRLTYYPLFNEYELTNLTYPSRQQLHSQRYYAQRNYTYLNEFFGTMEQIVATAKTLINKEENYDFGSNKQTDNIVFK